MTMHPEQIDLDTIKALLAQQKDADLIADAMHGKTLPSVLRAMALVASEIADRYPAECEAQGCANEACAYLIKAATVCEDRESPLRDGHAKIMHRVEG